MYNYLKHLGAYTQNYLMGVQLCQYGHIYDVETTYNECIAGNFRGTKVS